MSENGETTTYGALLFVPGASICVWMVRDRMLDYEEDVVGVGDGCHGVWRVG